MTLITNVADLNFYRLNAEYRKIRDEILETQKGIYDLDVMKIKLEKRILDLNERARQLESNILADMEKRK